MREAKDNGAAVEARLRAVLDGAGGAARASGDAGSSSEGGALSWDDLLPGWSEEDLAGDERPFARSSGGGPGAGGGPGGGSPVYPWDGADLTPRSGGGTGVFLDPAAPRVRPAAEAAPVPGAGAFGGEPRPWLHAFNPGRGGVRALVAVAVVVVLVAAFLAWRARPRVDQVAPPPAEVSIVPSSSAGQGSAARVVVAVGGKVRKPGLVHLAPGARVADALTAAGGAEPGVDVAMLNLARKVTDGELIMVGVSLAPGAVPGVVPGPPSAGAPGALVNLNTATLADLDQLPGVGPVLAQRIVETRDAQGGFRAVGDLRKVSGIGDARFEQLKDLVTVG